MTIITVPKPLRDKLGEEASDSLVTLLQKTSEDQKIELFSVLEDKFAHRLEVAIGGVTQKIDSLDKKMIGLESSLLEKINTVEGSLLEKINTVESSLNEKINVQGIYLYETIKSTENGLVTKINTVENRLAEKINFQGTSLLEKIYAMESGIRKDMNAGFVDLHKAITSQTKWILVVLLGAVTLYPIAEKIADRFF